MDLRKTVLSGLSILIIFISLYGVQAFEFDLGSYIVTAKLDFFDTIQPSIEWIDHHEGSDIDPGNGNEISYKEDSARILSSQYQANITMRVYDRLISPSRDDMAMQAILYDNSFERGGLIEETIAGHPGFILCPEEGLRGKKFVAVTWLADNSSMADTNVVVVSEYPWGSGNEGTTQMLVKSMSFEKR